MTSKKSNPSNKQAQQAGTEAIQQAAKSIQQFFSTSQQQSRHQLALAKDWADIFTGKSELEPAKGDRRFKGDIWNLNPFYRSMMQSQLALQNRLDDIVSDMGLSHTNQERMRKVSANMLDALAPTNTLAGNPEAMKKALDTGGQSLFEGGKNYIDDLMNNGGMPSQVDKSAFKVGDNVAATPGQVVYRTEMQELIQYQPTTARVHKRPLLMVPPQINKYYIYDLAPGRSLIEYAVSQGFQVFAVSWRNPTKEHSDWGFDYYVKALEGATEVVCDISGSKDLNVLGACSGGITVTTLMAYLAARDIQRINSLSLMVSVLDTGGTSDTSLGLFANRDVLQLAKKASSTAGLLEGKKLGQVFAWLRPNDLVWSYWVNNYLLGNQPPSFDLLYWNSDTTNMPAQLHSDFINLIEQNPLVEPGMLKIDDTPIDLKKLSNDTYVIAGTTDHITPWKGCYRTVNLLGGKTDFVLSSSGHVQAIVNPPGNPKAKFYTTDKPCKDSDEYLKNAKENAGSWWEHWQAWLDERSGKKIAAPKMLGNANYPPMLAAPGSYVKQA